MKKTNTMQKKNNITKVLLTSAAVGVGVILWRPLTAEATSSAISAVEASINQHENELGALTSQISDIEEKKSILQEEIDDLTSEITNTITSIGLKEDEITEKEAQIEDKKAQIEDKKAQIEETQAEYEAAVEREEKQRESMIAYMRLMYEQGDSSYLSVLLEGKGLADLLNRMGYIERVYAYANQMLEDYIDAKNAVHDLWDRLEEEKQELEEEEQGLEEDKRQLKADHQSLEEQRANLDNLLEQKKKTSANYAAEIAKAKQEAAAAKALIQQEKNKLKSLQAQLQREQTAANAAGATYSATSYSSVIDSASGSELGKQVARFACQYIGNPYVYGGTSLTNGADCSGFTYRVYDHFGYSLRRTSYDQRSDGTAVSYQEAQPGDIICYEGHVALYIGGGLIVHASNSNPYPSGGIKVSKAQYREILTVRRII